VTDAARRIAAQFAPAESIDAVHAYGGGHINDTFLVTTTAGDYVLQRINRAVFADPARVMENIVRVSAHLRGRFVPELVPDSRGAYLVFEGETAWRAWRRVPDAEPVRELSPAHAGAAARLLGRFHAGLADLEPASVHETLPRFHDPAHRLALLRAAVEEDACGRVAGVGAEIEAAYAAAPLAEIAAEFAARVPTRVAHNDAKLDNVLFRADLAICLVDLDTVMPTAWFWDVGDLLRTASTPAAEDDARPGRAIADRELHDAILEGYRAGLSETAAPSYAEEEALEYAGAIVTYEQALRFLTDWIAGDVYYRTYRRGHNLDRARAQLNLLASMPGTVA
jgi:Ser/Thr protein kinase RdoA (MazF antagonist)